MGVCQTFLLCIKSNCHRIYISSRTYGKHSVIYNLYHFDLYFHYENVLFCICNFLFTYLSFLHAVATTFLIKLRILLFFPINVTCPFSYFHKWVSIWNWLRKVDRSVFIDLRNICLESLT